MTLSEEPRKEYTIDEWRAEFKRRCKDHGSLSIDSISQVAFKCPACGTVYTLGEWAKAAGCDKTGVVSNDGPTSCIHRVAGDGVCDWVAYGLFCGPVTIVHPNGGKSHCFEFADSAGKPEAVE